MKPTMKPTAILICLAVLSGCAAHTTLDELTAQALQTGDWSKVEQRERYLARRQRHGIPSCPDGAVAHCINRQGANVCQCVSRGAIW